MELVGRLIKFFEVDKTAMIKRWEFRAEVPCEPYRGQDPRDAKMVLLEVELEFDDGSTMVGEVAENDLMIRFDDEELAKERFGHHSLIFGFDTFVGEGGEEPTPPGIYYGPAPEEGGVVPY